MKKLAIIALLVAVLIACAPVMPEKQAEEQPEEPEEAEEEPVEQNEEVDVTPTLDTSELPVKEVVAGELLSFPNLRAVDPDGDPITYTFTEPLNENGEWQTEEGDEGDHIITITASDGVNTISQPIVIRVKPKNRAPIIEIDQPVKGREGGTVTLSPAITDPDGDVVSVTYSGWMTSNTKKVEYGESGLHEVVITASDGKASTSLEVTVEISNVNQEPEIAELSPITVKEGEEVRVRPTARDPDGDVVKFIYEPPLDEHGRWKTKIGDAGEYKVTITATDGSLNTEATVLITVEGVNRPPVIELDSPVVVNEGQTVTLTPIVTDPEGEEVKVTYSGWMSTNTKYTTYEDAGEYDVLITAKDKSGNTAELEVLVVVEEVNRPPVFGAGSFD